MVFGHPPKAPRPHCGLGYIHQRNERNILLADDAIPNAEYTKKLLRLQTTSGFRHAFAYHIINITHFFLKVMLRFCYNLNLRIFIKICRIKQIYYLTKPQKKGRQMPSFFYLLLAY